MEIEIITTIVLLILIGLVFTSRPNVMLEIEKRIFQNVVFHLQERSVISRLMKSNHLKQKRQMEIILLHWKMIKLQVLLIIPIPLTKAVTVMLSIWKSYEIRKILCLKDLNCQNPI